MLILPCVHDLAAFSNGAVTDKIDITIIIIVYTENTYTPYIIRIPTITLQYRQGMNTNRNQEKNYLHTGVSQYFSAILGM